MNSQEIEQAPASNNKAERGHADPNPQPPQVYRPRRWLAALVTGGLAVVGVGGFAWLVWASQAFSDAADGVKFVTEGSIALALLLVAAVQASVYWSQRRIMRAQWEAMQSQLSAMRTTGFAVEWQAEIMEIQTGLLDKQVEAMQGQLKVVEKQLVIGTRSYVGVHSIDLRRDTKTIILKIENTGNVPADGLKVSYKVVLIEPTWGTPTYNWQSDVIEEDFGNIKLFRGNLQIHITIELRDFWIKEKASQIFSLINNSGVKLHIEGRIDYRDGFGPQDTEFAFVYDSKAKQDSWSVYSPEVVEAGEREAQRIWDEMNSAGMESLDAVKNEENYTNEE